MAMCNAMNSIIMSFWRRLKARYIKSSWMPDQVRHDSFIELWRYQYRISKKCIFLPIESLAPNHRTVRWEMIR